MGLRIKLDDTNFSHYIGISKDINHPNLIGYYNFDSSGVVRNLVTGEVVRKVGNPIFGENFVQITGLDGLIDDALVTSGNISYVAIANAGAAAMICGHIDYDVSPPTGDAILRNTKFTLLCNNATLTEVDTRTAAVRFVAGVIGDTTKDLYVSNAGALVKTSGTKTSGNPNTVPFHMGGHSANNVLPQQTTLYSVAVFNTALLQTEVNDFYTQFKGLFPQTS
ncbi:hypothetical protein [Acinetobacter baumannii]|uniref:hypothetical protein n=1 Tax=Acinetobacter baumannii TaxID=470 RepID=UPI0038B5B137